jgi:hypothetical protein
VSTDNLGSGLAITHLLPLYGISAASPLAAPRRVWHDDLLRPVLLTAVGWNLSWLVLYAVSVPYAVRVLGLRVSGVGVTLASDGVGMVVGALMACVARWPSCRSAGPSRSGRRSRRWPWREQRQPQRCGWPDEPAWGWIADVVIVLMLQAFDK